MTKPKLNQKGFGIIGFIILLAFVFALVNVYAYFNPTFSLAKYSPLNYFRMKLDEKRVSDLKDLEKAVLAYYSDHNQMPATDGWCGRITGLLHPEFTLAVQDYLPNKVVPKDPTHSGDFNDYFYYRVDRDHYILMASLDVPTVDTKGKYNYIKCHDWPGDDVYNYQLNNLTTN
jgi:hypothetical protein